MRISAQSKLCLIIGDPVEQSLSPQMHNAAYEALGIDDQFLFAAAHVNVSEIETVVKAVKVMGIHGLTCTIPHKIAVMPYLDEIDPIAKKIGAVNTVVNEHGRLKGYNTDWIGTVTPLELALQTTHRGSLKGKKVALIGAGGAARAIAYGVTMKGAELTVFNRTIEKAEDLKRDFNAKIRPLAAVSEVADHDILINATSLGMGSQQDETPVPKEYLQKNHLVFDAVYSPKETRLLREAQEQSATVIYGLEMLLYQGIAQFKLYTGHDAPEAVMRKVLLKHLDL